MVEQEIGYPSSEEMEQYHAEMRAFHKEMDRRNTRLMDCLKRLKGRVWAEAVVNLCDDCGVYGYMSVTRKAPSPKNWVRRGDFPPIKGFWVSQSSVGTEGDSWEGTIWVKIDSRRYLKLQFAL